MRHYEVMVILDPTLEERTIAPSLEVIGGSHTVMRSEPPLLASNAGRDQDWIEQRFPAQRRIVAAMDPGDALMFDHFTMHRSQAMTSIAPRISGEFRVTTLGVPPHRAGFAGRWAALALLRTSTRSRTAAAPRAGRASLSTASSTPLPLSGPAAMVCSVVIMRPRDRCP